jgi:hypothetical protein
MTQNELSELRKQIVTLRIHLIQMEDMCSQAHNFIYHLEEKLFDHEDGLNKFLYGVAS